MARPHRVDPIKGHAVGDHLAFERSERDETDGRWYWICRCVCGTEVRRKPATFLNGYVKSCGCRRTGPNHRLWKGCGSLSGHYFACVRASAKVRRIEFDISIEYAWEAYERQQGRCALTGLPILFAVWKEVQSGRPGTASLDRIDSSKGYVEGNIQWVHKDVNYMKSDYPQERFVEICKLVAAKFPDDSPFATVSE